MKSEYIVNCDIYNDIGQVHKWVNSHITVTGEPSASEVAQSVREMASKDANCLPRNVRIVGLFKL